MGVGGLSGGPSGRPPRRRRAPPPAAPRRRGRGRPPTSRASSPRAAGAAPRARAACRPRGGRWRAGAGGPAPPGCARPARGSRRSAGTRDRAPSCARRRGTSRREGRRAWRSRPRHRPPAGAARATVDGCSNFRVPGWIRLNFPGKESIQPPMHDRRDSSGAFVLALAGGPFLLPVIGVRLQDLIFLVPLMLAVWATCMAVGAARRRPARRLAWSALAAGAGITVVASALAVIAAVSGTAPTIGLYVGLAASVALVAAFA